MMATTIKHYAESGGAYSDSYYAFSANQAPLRPPLEGACKTDVCIVGGGYSGL